MTSIKRGRSVREWVRMFEHEKVLWRMFLRELRVEAGTLQR